MPYEITHYTLNDGKGIVLLPKPVICHTEDEIDAFETDLINRLNIGVLSMILVYRREAK